MKFDEWAVRKWLETHPDQAKSILTSYTNKTAQDANTLPSTPYLPPEMSLDSSILQTHELIFDIAKIVYSSLDLETVIESVLGIIGNIINAERCSLFLLDKKTNELYTVAFDVGSREHNNEEDGIRTSCPGNTMGTHTTSSSPNVTEPDILARGMQTSNLSTGSVPHAIPATNSDSNLCQNHAHQYRNSILTNGPHWPLTRHCVVMQTYNSALIVEDVESAKRTRCFAEEASRHHKPNPGIRIPAGIGVAGYVAQTRQGLNISDAYADPRFNPAVDKQTGFKTESILCLPIFGPVGEDGQPELVGVASLVNKIGSTHSVVGNGDHSSKIHINSPSSLLADQTFQKSAISSTIMTSTGTDSRSCNPSSPHENHQSYNSNTLSSLPRNPSTSSLDNRQHEVFTDNDTQLFKNLLVLVGIAIKNAKQYQISKDAQIEADKMAKRNNVLYEKAQLETEKGKMLLQLASTLYVEDDTKMLIQKIICMAKQLMSADKASFFIVDQDKRTMHSSVFDNDIERNIVVPMDKGIAGYVATTGKLINLKDAYADSRFSPDIDIKTNYHTHSILSVPVMGPNGNIVGVANLVNKLSPGSTEVTVFTEVDETMFSSFAVFCGLALHKTMLLEEIETQRLRLAVTMEIMSFHSTIREEESQVVREVISTKFVPVDDLRMCTFDPHTFPHADESLVAIVYQMFIDLSYGTTYKLPDEKMINYILTVRKNYRPVAYHNFTHAVSVTHAFYSFVVNGVLDGVLDHIEQYAMFVACLNHDIDHRGTNNMFQKQAHTELANFYSTSTMERHHFNHAMTILSQGSGVNILQHLNSVEYQKALKVIEHSILATDLGVFFSNRGKVNAIIATKEFDKDIIEHRELVSAPFCFNRVDSKINHGKPYKLF
ncbi:3',5'-cyclic-nucleotide phosphodiesterase, variant 2 [Batrachochytrium dendrobatidis]